MSKRVKVVDIVKDLYRETKRSSLIVYLVLRFLVILCMILQIIRGDINNALLCLLSLVLLLCPLVIQNKFEITLPNTLEITIYLFIFSAEILGEINNFYHLIPYWDSILHTLNGFLATAIGFSLIDLLNKNSRKFSLSPVYLCLFAFCFSMTIGILWEFFEYGADKILGFDMQKDEIVDSVSTVYLDPDKDNNVVLIDNIDRVVIYDDVGNVLAVVDGYLDIGINDTMKDLFVNFIGALIFCIFGYFYLESEKINSVISNFVPVRGRRKLSLSVRKKIELYKKSIRK